VVVVIPMVDSHDIDNHKRLFQTRVSEGVMGGAVDAALQAEIDGCGSVGRRTGVRSLKMDH
jgi:hypothetical protein